MSETARIAPEAGLIDLGSGDPRWIWAFTCQTPGCDCRTAVVLSTPGDRETLLARGAPVGDAWRRRDGHAKAAAELPEVITFALDIDEGVAEPLDRARLFSPLDLDEHPEIRDVAQRIDGDALDAIARLWYRGKGWPDPEEQSRAAREIKIESWKIGEVVAWGEALVGVRQDIYRLGERVFDAIDIYCVAEGCDCGEVVLDFAPLLPRGAPDPGKVRIARSGIATLEPEHEKHRERLEELWGAFRQRHPRHRERFASRSAVMHGLAGRIVGVARGGIERRTPKVGRNDPCPCGSGKKYKKCCGLT